jgi:cytochrome c-type biogenesis protein CcmH/NrfF
MTRELGCWYCSGTLESIADAEAEMSQEVVRAVYACNECGARYVACYDPVQEDK